MPPARPAAKMNPMSERPVFSVRALGALIGPDAARALSEIRSGGFAPMDTAACAALERRLGAMGTVQTRVVGHSFEGRPITMLSVGQGPVSVLAWGYPHPDEPGGAAALGWLAERLAGGDPALCGRARFHLVLCADPDQARFNDRWARSGALEDLLETVRPEHLEREIDYGFPLRWGPFEQPDDYDGALACHIAGRCVGSDGCEDGCLRDDLPAGPYPESLALAAAMRLSRPDLVVSMHETVTGGCFTFLLERPDGALADALVVIPEACGLPRQRGQKIDSGRPWRRGEKDLIREPRLEAEARRFLRRPGVDPAETYLGNASAAMHLQSLAPGAQFLVPEAPHLTHADFGDLAPSGETRRVRAGWEERRPGRRWCVRGRLRLPDGADMEILYRMSPTRLAGHRAGEQDLEATVGMLGMEAIMLRRWAFAHTDALWAALPAALRDHDHLVAREHRAMKVPAAHVNDASARIYRLSPYSDTPARVADRADFDWRWRIETARRPARLGRFIDEMTGPSSLRAGADALTRSLIAPLPGSLHRADARPEAAISQLARLLLCADRVNAPGAAWVGAGRA